MGYQSFDEVRSVLAAHPAPEHFKDPGIDEAALEALALLEDVVTATELSDWSELLDYVEEQFGTMPDLTKMHRPERMP